MLERNMILVVNAINKEVAATVEDQLTTPASY